MPLFLFLSNGNSYSTSERVRCGDDPVRYLENQMKMRHTNRTLSTRAVPVWSTEGNLRRLRFVRRMYRLR